MLCRHTGVAQVCRAGGVRTDRDARHGVGHRATASASR
jgi:hypothetical protein